MLRNAATPNIDSTLGQRYPHVRMSASKQLTRELAHLARLRIDEDEAEVLGAQLQSILAYIDTLRAVDVSGVEEYRSEDADSGLRADERGEMLDPEAALTGAPDRRGRQLAVPKFK